VQDTAYQSLLKSRRQQLHQQIAQVLEKRVTEIKDTQPELLAHHYTEGGLVEQAIPYWQRGGQRASQRSANMEAISHLTKGLELLKTLPDPAERAQKELTLQIALGAPLRAAKGWAAPQLEQAYARARELCRQVEETSQLFPMLWGLSSFYITQGRLQTARELGEQCLSLARSLQDPASLVGAHYILGVTLSWLGELPLAKAHLEQGIALYDPQQHSSYTVLYGADPGVSCFYYVALTLWFLGYPDQALKRIHETRTLTTELSHPLSRAQAVSWAAILHQHRRERQAAHERAEAAITLSSEQGFAFYLAMGTILRSWALAEQGQGEESIVQMRQGLTAYQTTGAELARSYWLSMLAEACGEIGRIEEGLTLLAEALTLVDKTGARRDEAELYRLKGELTLQKLSVVSAQLSVTDPRLLAPDPQGEAEACFHKAIEVAQKQQAKSLELRAVMSLARLWQSQGKQDEARQRLAEIYGWFTEGFDTKDLQEAKMLLEMLKGSSL